MLDTTFHVNDLLTIGGIVGGGAWYLARTMRKEYLKFKNQFEAHSEELSLHAGVLEDRLKWRRPSGGLFEQYDRRKHPRAEVRRS